MDALKQQLDSYYGLVSVLKFYDTDKLFATLHYFAPTGPEMFYIACVCRQSKWQMNGGQWAGI